MRAHVGHKSASHLRTRVTKGTERCAVCQSLKPFCRHNAPHAPRRHASASGSHASWRRGWPWCAGRGRRPGSGWPCESPRRSCACWSQRWRACVWYGHAGARGGEGGSTVSAEVENASKVTHDSLAQTYTHDGEVIRWYVLVDPDTSVQYLVNDRGGCCPRLNVDGTTMGVSYD